MREFYTAKSFYGFATLLLLGGAIGCHQDPLFPTSAIPRICQIYQIANVDEGVRDTTTYRYNAFGHVDERIYRQWVNGILTVSTKQNFTYSADHFLLTQASQTTTHSAGGSQAQDNKNYTYMYQDAQIQRVTVSNALSGQALGSSEYTYENGKLKTYTETNAQKTVLLTYTYDGTGKLTQFVEPGITVMVTNGKITKKTLPDGTVISYQFDGQGQLINESSVSTTNQTERTYTYDNAPHWSKTQLLLRGIPSLDLGGHTLVHNIIESTIKRTQNNRLVQDQKFKYQAEYTKEPRYLLGYARSDGARQRIFYANCP